MTPAAARKPAGATTGKPAKRPRGRQKGTRICVLASERIIGLRARLDLPDSVLTYRDVADELTRRAGKRVGLGTIHRFARGIEPDGAELRKVFVLPTLAPAPVCQGCGIVHTKPCPRERMPSKPRAPSLRRLTLVLAGLLASGRMVVKG